MPRSTVLALNFPKRPAHGSYLVKQPHEEHGQAGVQHVVEGDEPVFVRSLRGEDRARVITQDIVPASSTCIHSPALLKQDDPRLSGGCCHGKHPSSAPADGMALFPCNGQNKKPFHRNQFSP